MEKNSKNIDLSQGKVIEPKPERPAPYLNVGMLELEPGYTVLEPKLMRPPAMVINPQTKQPMPGRVFTCDYKMTVLKSDKYKIDTEVFIRSNAEMTPVLVDNDIIHQAVIRTEDILGIVQHTD